MGLGPEIDGMTSRVALREVARLIVRLRPELHETLIHPHAILKRCGGLVAVPRHDQIARRGSRNCHDRSLPVDNQEPVFTTAHAAHARTPRYSLNSSGC